MCGIAGIYYHDSTRRVDENQLVAMRDVFTYRGPDDKGLYISGPVGLAHRRLSIIGLSTGHQPMSDPNQKFWIVFNGEIYNYRILRKELEKKGYSFKSESDTEVIIYLYMEYGNNCIEYLNGMFAFAICDESKHSLYIARDRMGIKPLYYYKTNNEFIFSSEIKSILKYDKIEAACNGSAVFEYFLYRDVAGEHTMFKDVMSLLPGHYMTVDSAGIDIVKYWDVLNTDKDHSLDKNSAKEQIEYLLQDAIKIRLMSEVPLGTFCSGGIDSSLVTAMAAGIAGEHLNTFSVGFEESDYDESEYAKIVSTRYETQHHELVLGSSDFSSLLPKAIALNDEPLHFANSVHILALSELTKKHVTVVLTGEGADELFLGYPRYLIPELAKKIKHFSWLTSPLLNLLSRIHKDHRIKKLRDYSQLDMQDIIMMNAAVNRVDVVNQIIGCDIDKKLGYRNELHDSVLNYKSTIEMVSLQDQLTYLISILNRQDRMSMGASVEARVPFLDYRLVEFANSLPPSIKLEKTNTKMLIKEIAEKYLPREVIYRRKSGFGVPLTKWMRDTNGLGKLVKEIIYDTPGDDYINIDNIRAKYDEHMSERADNTEILWTVVNYLIWREVYNI
ncbi:MAG: asparagine synthase (glutamine-hydrolyzing) [Candidatus Thiodiazotropha sp. (ex Codakia rugifera)]|nr:asparagine synthase (glutamine-hydrolyzing) [Candidatus Thiodiazotropha sp. (ex Codakia rugifera)]